MSNDSPPHRNTTLWGAAAVLLLGGAGWMAYQRQGTPEQVADRAMDTVIDRATGEAEEVFGEILGERPTSSRRPPLTTGDADLDFRSLMKTMHRAGTGLGGDLLDEIAGLTPNEEMAHGKQAHQLVARHHKLIDAPQQLRRIAKLAAPFLADRARPEIDYHFFVVDDPNVNAFAHLGGYVYVHRGLLDKVTHDDQLRFVIGHEIAHGDLRHCVKSVTAGVRAGELGGDLVGGIAALAYRAIALGYSQEQEFAADLWSYQQLRKQGRSHAQSLAGLALLQQVLPVDVHDHTTEPLAMEILKDHLRTHPPVSERIARLEVAKTDS